MGNGEDCLDERGVGACFERERWKWERGEG